MAILIAPTKSNLIKAKSSLNLSKSGFELLDQKRNVLIREMMDLAEKAKNIQTEISAIFAEAYEALQVANITLGIKNVEDMTYSIPNNESFDVLMKSIMGVDIPIIKYQRSDILPAYGFYNTNLALDRARQQFNEVHYKIYDLAEIENSIFKLAKEIEKTNKRTNALKHIQIPKYQEQIKQIQETLEEKEREDFFRLKRVKNKIRQTKRDTESKTSGA
ncbi:MAG: V-type ATP synthase subunit D [Eubacteriales bacterium]|jgi:V/A-type H+-transporting ATPase subunit D|nr:V-type ATP synthase subunit D [Eubacteriales bacterium]MDD3290177.1 V-type ATP synthase subunit D [Eubacteriales bacterium]MDD3864390.1 V-type ATP synthase subunit D [Eubacteriales bacterium]MDD4445711.1 V-type ATP synthase subunit D [Eubacteriales bacterium]